MNLNRQDITVGLIAGAATAALCLGVATGGGLSVILYLLSALPIMVAGLGWGLAASIIAVVISAIAALTVANFQTMLFLVATTALPAAAAAYWITLSRPADELGGPQDKLVWFPLSDVLFRLCLMVGAAFVLIGIVVGYGPDLIKPIVDQLITQLKVSNPELAFSDEGRASLETTLTNFIPFMQSLMWTLVLVGNLYIALRITRSSGQLKRPRDFFPAFMRMPMQSVFAIGPAAVIALMPGGVGHIGAALCGALAGGFILAGYALFHDFSRGKSWRAPAMFAVYFVTVMTMLPPVAFFIVGIFALSRRMPISNNTTNSDT